MTEGEWLTGSDPQQMLAHLSGKGLDRKLRLFACACVRAVWEQVEDPCCRLAVDSAERFADGEATWKELRAAYDVAWDATRRFRGARTPAEIAARDTASINFFAAARDASQQVVHTIPLPEDSSNEGFSRSGERIGIMQHYQSTILRDLIGNPFRPPPFLDPAWPYRNGGTVRRLAQAIYTSRSFADLPILADALEEAGCQEPLVLAHCRGSGPHFRGCWVLDALLARE
jgi:hypothetical protein